MNFMNPFIRLNAVITHCLLVAALMISTAGQSSLASNKLHTPQPAKSNNAITFAVTGDWPYRKSQLPDVSRLIKTLNAQQLDFVLHIGDIAHPNDPAKDKLTCSNKTFTLAEKAFSQIDAPLMYTPGDNEWTDCARDDGDPYEPLERLTQLRKQFFEGLLNVEHYPFLVEAQAPPIIENRRWELPLENASVQFTTIHMVGSHNNLTYLRPRDVAEFVHRDEANKAWLKESFTRATKTNAAAMVIFFHADPHIEGNYDEQLGFRPFINQLVKQAKAFNKPVLIIHGDSHHFRVDTPFTDHTKPWPVAHDITRIITNGDPMISATIINITSENEQVKLTIRQLWPAEDTNNASNVTIVSP